MAPAVFWPLLFTAFLISTPCTASIVSSSQSVLTTTSHLHSNDTRVQKRAGRERVSTCGYYNGDPLKPRTANPGYDCRVDAQNGLWGFCPTTVLVASDCGLAGSCIDSQRCSMGCGFTEKTMLTTFTCSSDLHCSTALLTVGVDQTYSYLACGQGPSIDRYMALPTASATPTSSTFSSPSTSTTPATDRTRAISSPLETSKSEEARRSTTATSGEEHHPTSLTVPAAGPQSPGNGSSNLGAIIGGAIGGLAVLCASAVALAYLMKRRRDASTVTSGRGRQAKYENDATDVRFQNDLKASERPRNIWGPLEMSATPVIRSKQFELPG